MGEEYNVREVEARWKTRWNEAGVYNVEVDANRPKYYVLDMFPYPSGAGLHVGHPLGYIASDIYSRYKRMRGYNVLHPMGYDAFGLPAEQYAIQTGQHPAETTRINCARYRQQLELLGLSYDWRREFRTSDPDYYHWTQWAFLQFFNSYFDVTAGKARPIQALEEYFAQYGSEGHTAFGNVEEQFSAAEWQQMGAARRDGVLHHFRLAYRAETSVNWCEALGTVLANDEVKEGLSVRGGYPVTQRRMMQWNLRVSAYAERLLSGLDDLEWSDAMKEMQRNWIGRSQGASVRFDVAGHEALKIEVFTTRPDTLYGVTFMVLAPDHPLVDTLTTDSQRAEIASYIEYTSHRSERERIAETKKVTGAFTGSYAIHPLTGEELPVWIGDYVLMGYGTGAIMAVAAHDGRDFAFARHFGLPIRQVVRAAEAAPSDPATWEGAYEAKDGVAVNSPLWEGKPTREAIEAACHVLEKCNRGCARIIYRLRDAIFSRQRYWGEPIPIYYDNAGVSHGLPETDLPLELPEIDSFRPTPDGEPPLARAKNWKTREGFPLETTTMPGFAGSSAYSVRFMSPSYSGGLVSPAANAYWQDVDLYIGGTEHATGHLIYSRFWNKVLYDLGHVVKEEPFKRLVNQGMIQGRSNFIYRVKGTQRYVPITQKEQYDTTEIHVGIQYVQNDILDVEALRASSEEYRNAEFVLENGEYRCGWAVEKMSKSLLNVVNPDSIVQEYGADTLRMYEMFLGPLEMSKPWDTNGIDGVSKFLRKLWRYCTEGDLDDGEAPKEALRAAHKCVRQTEEGVERLSFNTCVSGFMIALSEVQRTKSRHRSVLEPLVLALCPFAPHICEELWHRFGHEGFAVATPWPATDERYLAEENYNYPISFNGKVRYTIELPQALDTQAVEAAVLADARVAEQLAGRAPKRVVVVKGKIVNIVI